MEFVLTCIWSAIIASLIARAVGQQKFLAELRRDGSSPAPLENLLVVIPARDEEHNIADCINGLLHQTYPRTHLAVRVIDDHSSDRTVSIASEASRDRQNVTIIESPPLPKGWVGKSHACWIGACHDLEEAPQWTCFIDADVFADPDLLTTAVSYAQQRSLDLLSLAPRHILTTWTERLVLPCGFLCLAFCQDLKSLQARDCENATATGQFLLVRTSAYFSVGGHSAIRNSICEDVALARNLKRNGFRVELANGHAILSTRMYRSWATLKEGLAKNILDIFGGGRRTICIMLTALVLASSTVIIPTAEGIRCARNASGACGAFGMAVATSAAAFGLHMASAVFFKVPPWYGLLFPLGYLLGARIAAKGLQDRIGGRTIWKDRVYR